jgi:hypothetical protein
MTVWKPFEFADALRRRWGAIVTSGALIGALGIWQGLGHIVPPSVYWTVALAGLAVALYKVWEAENTKCLTARSEIEQEKSLHGGPEISFGWGAVPPLNTRRTLFIENSGETDAYEVKVDDIGLNKIACAARFAVIPKCPKNSKEPLSFNLTGNSVPPNHTNEIEMVVYASGSDFSKDEKGKDVVDLPIRATFEEYGGARYEANFRLLGDTYLEKVSVHRVSRK